MPVAYLQNEFGITNPLNPGISLAEGFNEIIFTSHSTSSKRVKLFIDGATDFTFTGVAITSLVNYRDITSYFDSLPSLNYNYFSYPGDTLRYLIPDGTYYMKITMDNDYIYYSDWFHVDCVYDNLISSLSGVDITSTLTETYIVIASAGLGSDSYISSNEFNVRKGEEITVIFNLGLFSGDLPVAKIMSNDVLISNEVAITEGINSITFTISDNASDAELWIYSAAAYAAVFMTTMISVYRSYSEKYLIIDFTNTCDLGDILYQEGFTQTAYLESEPMEMTFPQEDKGIENGEGRFIRTFARQTKKYLVKTKELPDYMVEVFNRMRLHDTVEITDLVGDTNDVYNLEVEHEWLWDDRYYVKLELTFDYDETFVIGGCCNNIT